MKGARITAALENLRHERFANEYIIDYNGTQAAIRSEYSEKTAGSQASRLLKDVKILTRVRELQAEQTARLCVTADWVVQKLVEVTEKSMQAVPVEEWDYEEKCMRPTGEYTYDSKGVTKALELLGKHVGMFMDKIQLSGGIDVKSDKLDKILEQLKDDG